MKNGFQVCTFELNKWIIYYLSYDNYEFEFIREIFPVTQNRLSHFDYLSVTLNGVHGKESTC